MNRQDMIREIEALWAENPIKGWNLAHDVVTEIGLGALTDDALNVLADRYRREFGDNATGATNPAGQMTLAI